MSACNIPVYNPTPGLLSSATSDVLEIDGINF